MISADDFEAWRANPVTEYVFAALEKVAVEMKEDWLAGAWNGQLSPEAYATAKGKWLAYSTVLNMTLDGVLGMNGDSTEDADEAGRTNDSASE